MFQNNIIPRDQCGFLGLNVRHNQPIEWISRPVNFHCLKDNGFERACRNRDLCMRCKMCEDSIGGMPYSSDFIKILHLQPDKLNLCQELLRADQTIAHLHAIRTMNGTGIAIVAIDIPNFSCQISEAYHRVMVVAVEVVIG
jgi:hypothetical protein